MQAAVFALDRWLCRQMGVYEFSDDPHCLFRIQPERLNAAVALTDGTRVPAGGRALSLHLWNEHVPRMRGRDPTLAWACRIDHAMRSSLRTLAGYLAAQPGLADIAAIFADMRVNGSPPPGEAVSVLARYGFEAVPGEVDGRGALHRLGDAIYIAMLVSVTHPLTPRSAALRMGNVRMWLSRATLERRYASGAHRLSGTASRRRVSDRHG